MENTAENEQKFRALYLGLDLYLEDFKRCQTTLNLAPMNLWPADDKSDIIELTPLSSITDEDAIECGVIGGFMFDRKNVVSLGKTIAAVVVGETLTTKHSVRIYQYLQSKGYALPYMGISVEELVSRGWVKLKEG